MTLTRIDLEEISNQSCTTKCNKQKRFETTENDLCIKASSIVDNLPVRCVGQWAVQKIYFLHQYFGIFSAGMKNKWEVNYIEICSGPGRCISRENGKEFNGTAITVLKHPAFAHLNKALFFDFNPMVVETLNKRIKNLNIDKAKAYNGDYYNHEDICNIIKKEISPNSLNIVFIDPTDCSVPFSLIRSIKATISHVDFIINIATGTDYNRNIKETLLNQEKYSKNVSKYSRFIGSTNFFKEESNINLAKQGRNLELRNSFRDYYINSLKDIGYKHFKFNRIENLYDILFATQNEKGIEFWEKANKYKYDGQQSLF